MTRCKGLSAVLLAAAAAFGVFRPNAVEATPMTILNNSFETPVAPAGGSANDRYLLPATIPNWSYTGGFGGPDRAFTMRR